MSIRIAPAVLFLFLASCGMPERQPQPRPTPEPTLSNAEREERRAAFAKMAPKGWTLTDFQPGKMVFAGQRDAASYDVAIASDSPGGAPVNVKGAVVLGGTVEDVVKLGWATSQMHEHSAAEIAGVAAQFPDFAGYTKRITVATFGYDMRAKKDVRNVEYFSLEKKISCYGWDPGQMKCYWGTPQRRWVLDFYSKDLAVVIPYVMTVADAQR